MNFLSVPSVNSAVEKDTAAFVSLSEDIYDTRITAAARHIKLLAAQKPLVLISGPSGSAKTSTARRLTDALSAHGVPAQSLSMDNYFLPLDAKVDIPRAADGSVDYESPYRMDIPLFQDHLRRLTAGEEVVTPVFDFLSQCRVRGIPVKRQKGGVVIIEGIHALNPLVTGDSESYTFSVYVSVATRLITSGGVSVNPPMLRLMRRLCRDRLYRGRTMREIWDMVSSVALGEENYITPFRGRADLDMDSFIPYEACVYKNFLMRDLKAVSSRYAGNADFSSLYTMLSEIVTLPPGVVPKNSVVREFMYDHDFNRQEQ
jgi:uridine kinase